MNRSFLLIVPILLLASGCVSKSAYQQKVGEADTLSASVRQLQSRNDEVQEQNQALSRRNDTLEDQLAEARARVSALQEDLIRARADLDRIEKILSARSVESGEALAALRKTVDRLQQENRSLMARVEQERAAREERVEEVKGAYDELVRKMETEIRRGEVTISELKGQLTVNMVERVLFDTGKAEVKPAGLEVLRKVGDILKEAGDKEIRIEGHTDNVPISPRLRSLFPSNWELSTARATNVLRFLENQVGIPGERLAACGFGEHRPIVSNDTPEGRAQNRRIQIVLVPLPGGR